MTEIEIRDPDPSGAAEGDTPEGAESPYKNLLVPLVVVPALIVMVLVAVGTFVMVAVGSEESPRENLDRLLRGGYNVQRQAAFALARQVMVYQQARAEGRSPEWEIDDSFLPELSAARDQLAPIDTPEDVARPFVLSSLLAQLGDPDGAHQLAELTRLPDELDPDGDYRSYAALTLAVLGPEMAPVERELAAATLIELTQAPDAGLALLAIAGLQRLPSEATLPTLKALLTSALLERRVTAALSLATLGDASGVGVLTEALSQAPYDAARAAEQGPWPAQIVSESRRKALAALFALGQPPPQAELTRLAEEDPDQNLRSEVRTLLDGRAASSDERAPGAD